MTAKAREEADRLLQAADWQMRIESGGLDREAFAAWLADPRNTAVWARLNGALDLISEHANDQKMVGFRRAALADAHRTMARLSRPPTRWKMRIAAMLLTGLVGGGAYYWLSAPSDYQTSFNERRTVTLADGSRILLDSDSEVTVRYTKTAREIQLVQGQARFDVAHDVTRPFSVLARDQKVVATGTAFNIDITQPKVLVTLIEGHVVVFDENGVRSFISSVSSLISRQPPRARDPVELHPGQQLAAIPDQTPAISRAAMRATLAWTGGQLIFDDKPLLEVVARIDHYAARPIMIADSRVARLHVSG
ncbi:MAG TPA: FecR domain-containing protein [Afipia sp.]